MTYCKERVVRSTCGICQVGCGILVHVEDGKVTKIQGDPESPLNEGMLCPKGLASLEYLYHPDRLQKPLKRKGKRGGGKWLPISWDEATGIVASELTKAKDASGAESVVFITGSFKGNFQEEYLRRFAHVFGSPNVAGQGHVCMVPRVHASQITYGYYAVPDFDHPPNSIIVWGKNLSENLPHVYQRLTRALDRGSKLVIVNPTEIKETDRASIWLKPRPGSDLALALAIINVIINEELYDKAFVDQWTTGFDELKAHVQDYPPEKAADITWVPAEMIKQAARFYAANRPACIQWGNAIDHGVNNFQTARALCILRAISGNLEVPGGDLRWSRPPIDASASGLQIPELIPPEVQDRRITNGLLPLSSAVLPQDTVRAIREGAPYRVRAAYVQGGNPLLTYSNAQNAYEALLELDFLAVADMFMTPTAALADIVLPVATYLESDDIVAPLYSLPLVQVQQKATCIGGCRSDYEILRDIAHRSGFGGYFWDTKEECLDRILEPAGISFDEFRRVGKLVGMKQYRAYQAQGFPTPSGKVELYSSLLEKWGFSPLPVYHEPPETPYSDPQLAEEYPLVLTSCKREPFRHSGGKQITTLRGSYPEPITSLHPETASRLGIEEGDWIYVETKRGRIRQKAALTPSLDQRAVCVDYAWWFPKREVDDLYGWAESNINVLTDDKLPFSPETGSANLRGMLCKVYRV